MNFDFPKGYGFLIKGNEFLFVTTQALNHNQEPLFKKIKHLAKYNGTQKPLMRKTVYIQLPYNKQNIFKSAISNYKEEIGLIEVAPFSSVEGIWLYENHEYELEESLIIKTTS